MRIEYVSLFVQDVQRSETFYQKYFRAREEWTSADRKSCMLSFSGDVFLELLKNAEPDSKRRARFAISVGGPEMIEALARAIENDGYECTRHLERTKDGRCRAVVLDPDENELELVEEKSAPND